MTLTYDLDFQGEPSNEYGQAGASALQSDSSSATGPGQTGEKWGMDE